MDEREGPQKWSDDVTHLAFFIFSDKWQRKKQKASPPSKVLHVPLFGAHVSSAGPGDNIFNF